MIRHGRPLKGFLFSHAAVFAFLSGVAVRAYPEVLAGPYPLGFDTTTGYLSTLMTTNVFTMSASQLLGGANLYYVVQQAAYSVLGDPFLTLKVVSVILYGLFALSIFVYSSRGLKLSVRTSLVASALASLSWLALRLSWDLERNVLGLSLAILTLALLSSHRRGSRLLAAPMALLAVWAHQLVAVFLLGCMAVELMFDAARSGRLSSEKLLAIAPASALFLFENYSPRTVIAVPAWSSTSMWGYGPAETWGGLVYFLLLSWPLLVLAGGIAFRRGFRPSGALVAWSAFALCFALLLPAFGLNTVWPYRVWLMMAFPLPILAAAGADAWPRLAKVSPLTAGSLLLLVLAVPFLSLPPEALPVNYALGVVNYGPSAYQQNVVPVEATPKLLEALKEASTVSGGKTLLLPEQFVGFSRYVHIDGAVSVGLVGSWYGNTLDSAVLAKAEGMEPPYETIWWKAGSRWYGVPPPSQDVVTIGGNDMFVLYEVKT